MNGARPSPHAEYSLTQRELLINIHEGGGPAFMNMKRPGVAAARCGVWGWGDARA